MAAAQLNPVERRLALLCEHWLAFRDDPQARLLLWQVPENAVRLTECFVEVQKHETPYTAGDLFLLLKPDFQFGMQYARDLKVALRGQYDASVDDLEREGMAADWAFDPAATPDTALGFAGALLSFGSQHRHAIGHLAVVLWPPQVGHVASWRAWLQQLLDVRLPERVRLLVVDALEAPRLAELENADDPRVCVQRPALDGLAVAQETMAQEGGTGPAAVFRNLMMGVVSLLDKGSADQVKARAVDALAFARRQSWADQEVALRVLVAGALLKEGRHAEAVTVYKAARQSAEQTVQTGHPAGHKLMLQTWMGQAGVHLAAKEELDAARCYDSAAEVAQLDGDKPMAIEAFRMGAFCLARVGDAPGSKDRAECALALGARLSAEERATTTLGSVIVDQWRLLDADRVLRMRRVKTVLQVQLEGVRERGDALAEQLAASRAPDALERVQRQRDGDAAQAAEEAATALAALVAGGHPKFREMGAQGDALLGPDWPVDDDVALPPLPPDQAKGVAA